MFSFLLAGELTKIFYLITTNVGPNYTASGLQ